MFRELEKKKKHLPYLYYSVNKTCSHFRQSSYRHQIIFTNQNCGMLIWRTLSSIMKAASLYLSYKNCWYMFWSECSWIYETADPLLLTIPNVLIIFASSFMSPLLITCKKEISCYQFLCIWNEIMVTIKEMCKKKIQ